MATPTEHVWREFAVFLRGPDGLDTFAFTTTTTAEAVRDGIAHAPQIVEPPTPADNAPDDFGILAASSFEVELVDEPTDDDWPILDHNGDLIQTHNGTDYVVQDY